MTEDTTPTKRALKSIRELVEAGRPLVYVLSPEEGRVQELLRDAATQLFPSPVPVFTWTVTEGLRGSDGSPALKDSEDPRVALDFIASHDGGAVFHLQDFHESMRASAEIRRRLRDLYTLCFDQSKFIFITAPVVYIPDELERDVALIDLPLPDFQETVEFLQNEAETLERTGATLDTDPATLVRPYPLKWRI